MPIGIDIVFAATCIKIEVVMRHHLFHIRPAAKQQCESMVRQMGRKAKNATMRIVNGDEAALANPLIGTGVEGMIREL